MGIIKKPIITEKMTDLGETLNRYAFVVDRNANKIEIKAAVEGVILKLDSGELRIAEKVNGEWVVNQWLKKAVLLSFILENNVVMQAAKMLHPHNAGGQEYSTK